MNLFRFTGAFPPTACWALATCSSMPRRVRRAWAEPMCSISRDPRCQEQTICAAVAPDAVFTVRTYGTGPPYGPGLVRNSSHRKPRNRRSPNRRAFQAADRVTSRVDYLLHRSLLRDLAVVFRTVASLLRP
jgi:hypothetical protein